MHSTLLLRIIKCTCGFYILLVMPIYILLALTCIGYTSQCLLGRGKSPITDPLLIPTPSHISVTIIYITTLYMHELLAI